MVKYERIGSKLKLYSFDEKMNKLQIFSSKFLTDNINVNYPLPWELETLLLFVIKYKEVSKQRFNKNDRDFYNILKPIRNYIYPKLSFDKNNTSNLNDVNEFKEKIMITHLPVQLLFQSNEFILFFRYNYFFNYNSSNINIKSYFINKFNITYDECINIIGTIYFVYKSGLVNTNIIKNIMFKNKEIIDLFSVTRDDFIDHTNSFAQNESDYLYCINPSYFFPFIINDSKTYLPLPHCLIPAATSSLCYRLTENNSLIKEKLGKVYEDYLFEIILKSHCYNEVLSEQNYNNNSRKTSDIMCKYKNYVLFFECKAVSTFKMTRLLDENSIYNERIKQVDAIIQLYKQLKFEFSNNYNFFNDKSLIDIDNRFGVVTLLDESYLDREKTYNDVINKLSLDEDESLWLKKHIRICSTSDIENLIFRQINIIDAILNTVYTDYIITTSKLVKGGFSQYMDDFVKERLSIFANNCSYYNY